ncbi:L-methionine/branched-chain amino acid transporter [Celerinatantimonas yamalensis]|uniref:L-methionine/branched-chain amino acid transporter n=1 Tax=Celerinatantimonas yamalensis TaxID=559956 RepID=A0ABW9GBK8_9GAMM
MSRLKPQLSLSQGIALLATTMLGTGVFVVPVLAARQTGTTSLLAWGALLLLTLPIAFTFAALGKKSAHAGGIPHIVGQAFGKESEKLTAFLFFAILPVGMPASLVIGSGFIQALIPLSGLANLAVQLGMLLGMLLLGIIGAKASGQMQTVIALLIVSLIASLWWVIAPNGVDFKIPLSLSAPHTLLNALGLMFWCIIGIEAFIHMGEEFRSPQRDFPLALILGTLLTLLIYWATSVLVLHDLPHIVNAPSAAALPIMTEIHLGSKAAILVTVLGFLACFASTNVYLQGYARLIWSLADEGKLPRKLATLSARSTPIYALVCITLISMLMCWGIWLANLPLNHLLLYTNGNYIVIYLLAMLAAVTLLKGYQRVLAVLSTAITLLFFWSLGRAMSYVFILCCIFICARLIWRAFGHWGNSRRRKALDASIH